MSHAAFTVTEYPESDGKPMGETDLHRKAMIRQIGILERYYAGQQTYVSGDLLLYYVQGNPKKFVVPDVFVVKGLRSENRRTFRLWNERIAPQVVIETTSKKTKKRDLKVKPAIYAAIGVLEYFLFDPTHDYLDPPLQGNRLLGSDYQPIDADVEGGIASRELGLRLTIRNGELEFFRLDDGSRLLDGDEAIEREVQACQREAEARQREFEARQRESEARQAAEAEIARLREKLRQYED